MINTKVGKYVNGKIEYYSPRVHFLSKGNWKTGWSDSKTFGGEKFEYEVKNPNNLKLEEGVRYRFIIEDKVAIIFSKAFNLRGKSRRVKINDDSFK